MQVSPLAGKPADASILINVPRLVTAYYTGRPDPSVPGQRVVFGTSGHRGCSLDNAFNEAHILAITQAICLYRTQQSIDGPLFIGSDTHALSEPAFASALEVLAANGVDVMVDASNGYTPTPVISHAALTYNRGRRQRGLLGRHRRALRPQPGGRESHDRSHLPLHDRGLGRPDPHGPFIPLRHGAHGRPQGPLRRGLCRRYRCRSTRNREP